MRTRFNEPPKKTPITVTYSTDELMTVETELHSDRNSTSAAVSSGAEIDGALSGWKVVSSTESSCPEAFPVLRSQCWFVLFSSACWRRLEVLESPKGLELAVL